jgi:hypothetical protein
MGSNRLEVEPIRSQIQSVVDARRDAPRDETQSRIQGSLGIGVVGFGERHTNGPKEARRAQQF